MAVPDDLLREITRTLPLGLTPNLTTANAACDLYEAYAHGLVLSAARAEGATVYFEDVHGNRNTQQILYRTGPGHIWSTLHNYTPAPTSRVNLMKFGLAV